jgi:signal transduction histidine kinase
VLHSLVKEIDRLDRIIQEMIDRTRPGELQRRKENLNLKVVEEVLRLATESLSAQQIRMERHLDDSLPDVYADSEKLKQVLWNLILNAKEAMPKGGILRITTGRTEYGSVVLRVDDTGQGIVSQDVERLFQPFFTTKPEGVGLGLTMSRKIVAKHGGRLLLENHPEGGLSATVILPIENTPVDNYGTGKEST